MFKTLSEFYNDDVWINFRAALIQERTKDDGFLYDEFSGEKLLKSHDIVAHHIQPLTMQNVNDVMVSLNPENVMLVSQRSHNILHARFGYVAQRKVYLVYGAPCSGKNTFVNSIKGNSDLVVDIDLVWQCITGGDEYRKPNALKQNAFMLRDCLIDMVKIRAGKWERAFVITGGARKSDRSRLVRLLGAELIFIDETKETCLRRLANDQKRDAAEWSKYIDEWFDIYQE